MYGTSSLLGFMVPLVNLKYVFQFQSVIDEVHRLKKQHDTLLDVVDGLKRENDELLAKDNIAGKRSNIQQAFVASLETALEEHVKAQSELYDILSLKESQRSVSDKILYFDLQIPVKGYMIAWYVCGNSTD